MRDYVKFVYAGTQLGGSNREKLDKLTALREKLENYSHDHGLKKALVDLKFEMHEPAYNSNPQISGQSQPTEINQGQKVLSEVDMLRKDYLQSGGSDPHYLSKLNNIQNTIQNSPSALQQQPRQPSPLPPHLANSYFQRQHRPQFSNDQSLVVAPMKQSFEQPLNKTQSQADLMTHPIYQFLPGSFKDELSKVLNESASLRDNPVLPIFNAQKSNLIGGPDSQSEEKMLEYLRHQEAELLLQMNRMNTNDRKYHQMLQKFKEIQNMKGVVEQSILSKKVRTAKDEALEVHNKRQAAFLTNHSSAINQMQAERGRIPVAYSMNEGLMVRWDFVSNLPIHFTQTRILYGSFRKGNDFYTYRNTSNHDTQYESFRSNKSIIMEKEIFREIEPYPDAVLFIELWVFTEEDENQPQVLGWTVIQLFDLDSQLLTGRFKLPFYPKEFNPNRLLNEESLPYIGNQALYLRICLPLDPVLDSNSLIFIESEYHVPEIHIHKTPTTMTLQEQFNLKDKTYLKTESTQADKSASKYDQNQTPAFNDLRLTKSQFTPNYVGSRSNKKLGTVESTENTPKVNDKVEPEAIKARPQLKIGLMLRKNQDQRKPTSKFGQKPAASPNQQSEEDGQLVLKIRQFKNLSMTEHTKLKVKMGLFAGNELIRDSNRNTCILFTDLVPTGGDELSCDLEFYHQIDLDFNTMRQIHSDQELNESYLFLAYFKDGKQLFGWNVAKLLEKNTIGGGYQLKSGIYRLNMYDPPGQSRNKWD